MNKLIILSISLFAIIACKKEVKNTRSGVETQLVNENELITLNAEFIKVKDAAVLKGEDFIYGVVLDDKGKELAEKVEPLKKTPYDMVAVVIKGVLKPNSMKEGWDQVVEIKDIVTVLANNVQPKNEEK